MSSCTCVNDFYSALPLPCLGRYSFLSLGTTFDFNSLSLHFILTALRVKTQIYIILKFIKWRNMMNQNFLVKQIGRAYPRSHFTQWNIRSSQSVLKTLVSKTMSEIFYTNLILVLKTK